MKKINLKGLEGLLKEFDSNGRYVERTHWSIASGGYDMYWELYYDGEPVISAIGSGNPQDYRKSVRLDNCTLDYKDYVKVCKKIISVYPECYMNW